MIVGTWQVNKRKVSSASVARPRVVSPYDLVRFVSAKNVHGFSSMKFVAVAYSNCSSSVETEYFDAPAPFARALKGVGCFTLLHINYHTCHGGEYIFSMPRS